MHLLSFSFLYFPWFCCDFFFYHLTFTRFFSFLCHTHSSEKYAFRRRYIYTVLLPWYFPIDIFSGSKIFLKGFVRKWPQWQALCVLWLPWIRWKLFSGYGLRFTPVQNEGSACKSSSPLPALSSTIPLVLLYQDVFSHVLRQCRDQPGWSIFCRFSFHIS